MWEKYDYNFMQRAHVLARKGYGKTWPNPMVGAVVVKNRKIIGEGWHRQYGGHHAETYALHHAGKRAKDATLYLNLEPCAHYGKTPPCADLVVKCGISRVVCSMRDPYSKVAGKGFKILKKAGVHVSVGLMKKEAEKLNEVFIKRVTYQRPFVMGKVAMSMDGKIACENGLSRWISGSKSRSYAHQLRSISDAVIVGMGTVIFDNPILNVRNVKKIRDHQPLRIILEGSRMVQLNAKMFDTLNIQDVVIASGQWADPLHIGKKKVPRWYLPGKDGLVDLDKLLERLGQMNMSVVLVEGGAKTHAAFLGLGKKRSAVLYDEMHVIMAPKIIGGERSPGPVGGTGVLSPDVAVSVSYMDIDKIGEDLLIKASFGRK